jgi:hypothetical protein
MPAGLLFEQRWALRPCAIQLLLVLPACSLNINHCGIRQQMHLGQIRPVKADSVQVTIRPDDLLTAVYTGIRGLVGEARGAGELPE